MVENSVYTSVAVEVANEENVEDQILLKPDYQTSEPPKDYVIDQIFCGDNITVYALFEISDTLDDKVLEISNSKTYDDLRFHYKTSYKNGFSFKDFISDYEKICENAENDVKVLYSKENRRKSSNEINSKLVSKGTNTNIGQSPKLLDEVQQAVDLKFSFLKNGQIKAVDRKKSSCEIIEIRQSSSSFSIEVDYSKNNQKNSPNFLVVPFAIVDEEVLGRIKNNEKEKSVEVQCLLTNLPEKQIEKNSQGVNTDFPEYDSPFLPNVHNINNQESTHFTTTKSSNLNTSDSPKENKKLLSRKASILQEIKKLQSKLDILIKSLESSDIDLNEEIEFEKLENTKEKTESDLKIRKSYEETPVNLSDIRELVEIKSIENKLEIPVEEDSLPEDLPVTITTSETSLTDRETSNLKENFSEIVINWTVLENWRGLGTSKSESNARFINNDVKTPSHGVKKSVSFDEKDEKLELVGMKKIKNLNYKVEPCIVIKKPDIRIMKEVQTTLGDNYNFLKNEMGDEVTKTPKNVKNEVLRAVSGEKNLEMSNIIHSNFTDINENDANKIINQKYMFNKENLIVQYCTNMENPRNFLKVEKNITNDKERGMEESLRFLKKPTIRALPEIKKDSKISSVSKVYKKKEIVKPKIVTGSRKLSQRGNADSKLHTDRLIKIEKPDFNPSVLIDKGESTSRLPKPYIQKRNESTKNMKNLKIISRDSQVKDDKNVNKSKKIVLKNPQTGKDNSESKNSSSVVVELYSDEKPINKLYTEVNKNIENLIALSKENDENRNNTDNSEKSVVRSVWALTKVVLYEDGSKKFEVLEASLTPLGYCMNKDSAKSTCGSL